MKPDKEVKNEFKLKASKEPEKYYSVKVLRKEGFVRKQCDCGTYFWTADEKQTNCQPDLESLVPSNRAVE